MALLQRLAMELVAMSPAQRDERYARIEQSLQETWKELGQPVEKAAENAAQAVGFVKALTEAMERGGGPGGSLA
jgi:hypothetical protein